MSNQSSSAFVSARAAAALLGVKVQTLYAYTSRGLVRSIPVEGSRARLYRREDLERLRARSEARSGHGPVAANALRFGEPVLESAITRITARGPIYRGEPALELATRDLCFASIAELLWTGALPETPPLWKADGFGAPVEQLRRLLPSQSSPLVALTLAVPAIAARDPARFEYRPAALLPQARALILRMAAALALPSDGARVAEALEAQSVARAVSLALGARHGGKATRAVRKALVIAADHELNVSAFSSRVTASAGGDLYACMCSALAALSGPRHGATSDRIEALLSEVERPERAARVVYERSRRGESIPGFGHLLYPEGDPRFAPLMRAAVSLAPRNRGVRTALALVDAMREAGRAAPTMDLGLVALTRALGMRTGSAVGLFAIGRAAGWIAHALEQYEAGFLMRPRASHPEAE